MKKLGLSLLVLCTLSLAACHEGPAEKKGKELDNAVQTVKDKIENKGPAQKLGEKVDDATQSDKQ